MELYRTGQSLQPHQLVFLDMRPDALFAYEGRLMAAAREALPSAVTGAAVLPALVPFAPTGLVGPLLQAGQARGDFRDTTLPDQWLGAANAFAQLPAYSLPPMTLVVARAEEHIDAISRGIMDRGDTPLGLMLSGATKMMTETHAADPSVTGTVVLARHFLEREWPLFGCCFGMQLLVYVAYNTLVDWVQVPAWMSARVVEEEGNSRHTIPVTAEARHWVFGVNRLEHRQPGHPLVRGLEGIPVIQSHAQYLPYPHPSVPDRNVLATSTLKFIQDVECPTRAAHFVHVTDLVQCGVNAFGAQSHFEVTGALCTALAHLPVMRRALEGYGYEIEHLHTQFTRYAVAAEAGRSGARYGENWVRSLLLPFYLRRLLSRHPAERVHLTHVLDALERKIGG